MKVSEILEQALQSYDTESFMCNIIEDLNRKDLQHPTNDYVRALNTINKRLGKYFTLSGWLYANNQEYKDLCLLADPDCVSFGGSTTVAMKNVYCYNIRVLYWHDLIDSLKAQGD